MFVLCTGALPEDHREEWLPGVAMGSLHHTKWRLSVENAVEEGLFIERQTICSLSQCWDIRDIVN